MAKEKKTRKERLLALSKLLEAATDELGSLAEDAREEFRGLESAADEAGVVRDSVCYLLDERGWKAYETTLQRRSHSHCS